jgi:hypothetical protein
MFLFPLYVSLKSWLSTSGSFRPFRVAFLLYPWCFYSRSTFPCSPSWVSLSHSVLPVWRSCCTLLSVAPRLWCFCSSVVICSLDVRFPAVLVEWVSVYVLLLKRKTNFYTRKKQRTNSRSRNRGLCCGREIYLESHCGDWSVEHWLTDHWMNYPRFALLYIQQVLKGRGEQVIAYWPT